MAEYVGKEQVIEWFRPYGHEDEGIPYYGLVTDIREMKPADVAPVVRCRDCMHLRPEVDAYTQETVGYWCAELDIGSVDVDGFCSRGERKDGADSDTDGSI